jgi:uncharacterized protein YggE
MKLLYLALLTFPVYLVAESGLPSQPYVYVVGEAQVEKAADMVTLRFSVVARNLEQGACNNEVQVTAGKIFTLLNSSKIAEKDVIASDLKSEAEYEANDNSPRVGRGKIIGYSATRPFTVTVRDLSVFAKLVDQLLTIGGLEFSGIDVGLSNQQDVEQQMWDKALANARDRAEKTTKSANMKITSTFAISPVLFPQIRENIFGSAGNALELHRDLITKAPDPGQYRLPPVSVSRTVHVIYLISPAK